MGLTSFQSVIKLFDGTYYKVILQHENQCRIGCIDVFAKDMTTKHYVRILGFNPFSLRCDSYKDYGKLTGENYRLVKKDFFYGNYSY